MMRVIDLRSDTVTKPTPSMRKAMAEAEVGDDVYREDPTILALERKGAELFGKEAALFFPTGTMGNLASVMSHCWERGQEILVGDLAHIHKFEQGGISQLAGVHPRTLNTLPDGTFDVDEIISKIQPSTIHHCRTALLCLENTHNCCGGVVLTPDYIEKVSRLVKEKGVKVHMDGARIMNAAVKLDIPVSVLLRHCDSVSVCLSKGLGAPAGTLIAGTSEFISRALRCRKVLGGGMRQSGVLAAAGIVALDEMVDRLKEDHNHATQIAQAIHAIGHQAASVNMNLVQTNMVMVDVNPKYITAPDFCSRLASVSEEETKEFPEPVIVKVSAFSPTRVRFVTHADVSSEDIFATIAKLEYVINKLQEKK